jgi:O-acetylhomoserine (thiol)-lyase
MRQDREYRFETLAIHSSLTPERWEGASMPPVYQTAAHVHPTAESLSRAFAGQIGDHIYARLTNPTNQVLEGKITALEGGAGTIVSASGMAAVAGACMALLRSGDEFVSSRSLFISTYLLFTKILGRFGIQAHLVDPIDPGAFEAAINEKTRFLYVETIGNPQNDIPDLGAIAKIAHRHDLPLIVDNTWATPYLCRPIALGADIVVHSTTKYLSGHGAVLGGSVTDGGKFDWPEGRFPDLEDHIDRKGKLAYLDKLWREQHINFGPTQAPWHSYLTILGLDTLALRMARHSENALAVARFLQSRREVAWVNYPGLETHPSHNLAQRQFGGRGFGGMLSFGLKDEKACKQFIDHLELIYHLANLGDCKTLVIHPYSTQFVSFDERTKTQMGVGPDLLRLSVGIEAADDICDDIGQALDRLSK